MKNLFRNRLVCGVALLLIAGIAAPAFADKAIAPRALFLVGGSVGEHHIYALIAQDILSQQGIDFRINHFSDSIEFEEDGAGQFSVVVLSDHTAYLNMDPARKKALDDYCRDNNVGQFVLYINVNAILNDGLVTASGDLSNSNQRIVTDSGIFTLTKDGGTPGDTIPCCGRMLDVQSGHESEYAAVATADTEKGQGANVLLDKGDFDGIRRIFFGHDFVEYWLHDLIFIDSLNYLSAVPLPIMTTRYIGVDVDDIFQPQEAEEHSDRTVKIQAEDVAAMIESQEILSEYMVGNFQFTLGFNCGFFGQEFGSAPYDDAAGDQALVDFGDKFYWFDHFPQHQRAENYDAEQLSQFMDESLEWAKEHGVDGYMTGYLLPPYNNGVYPVHEPLYQAMKDHDYLYTVALGVKMGFQHKNMLVAPRQPAGMDANQYSWEDLSADDIDASIAGGPLFFRVFHTPGLMFVSHQSNFARDRIGLYMFENLLAFMDRWTHYEFVTGDNDFLVEAYFAILNGEPAPYPDDDDDDDDDDDTINDDDSVTADDDDDTEAEQTAEDAGGGDSSGCCG